MKRFSLQISVLIFLLTVHTSYAQVTYSLLLKGVDQDATSIIASTGLQTSFTSQPQCAEYINKLPALLQSKGYVTASVDTVKYDSASAIVVLFLGRQYKWAELSTGNIDIPFLEAIGWRGKLFENRAMDFSEVQRWQERIIDQLENTGYPFARVGLDSLQIEGDKVYAKLKLDKGPFYKIDSIRLYGNAKISAGYLQRYLEIPNGSGYNKEKLLRVGTRIRELTYVEEEKPADLTMLGTGSVLNLYLKQKKSSQVNIIIGFLPNNDQLSSKKLLVTGEGVLNLRNALGSGETIGLNFQALQVSSQRLNLLYNQPYLFHSPLGLDFAFDIFRKDSSFVNINLQLGTQYILNTNQAGKLFIQKVQTIVNQGGLNTAAIIQNRRLPDIADVSSFNVGLEYDFNNTDYRLNPRKGNELRLTTSIGTKTIGRNNEIIDLKDPSDPTFNFATLYDTIKLKTYQLRVRAAASHYFPLGANRSTLKTTLNAGTFQSGNIFRNELFQIGGYKLLRGFDEESQYLSSFAIGTLEYRYLIANSYFYVFADGGWGQDNGQGKNINYQYIGTGVGLAFETKAGIFNLAWGVGKRNDTDFNLRKSKIHFGFVNYF